MRAALTWCWLLTLFGVALAAHGAELQRESRAVVDFDQIVISTPGELRVEQGTRDSLVIEAERSVLPKLASTVRNGSLHLEATDSFSTRQPIRFVVTVRRLSQLTSEAGAEVTLGPFEVPRLALRMSGTSTLNVASLKSGELSADLKDAANVAIEEGEVEQQRVRVSGAGEYNAPKLVSRSAVIAVDGVGRTLVHVREALSAEVAGSGTLRYRGAPALTQRISGAGSIERDAGRS